MMTRMQITLEAEAYRRARRRAGDLGVSVAEYLRRLVARDLASPQTTADPACVCDLGISGGSDIAWKKDSMVAEAFDTLRKRPRGR